MFELLQCGDIGMEVTESLAMTPAASVSGFYLSHPDSTYFSVGKIGDDQLKDLATRRQMNDRIEIAAVENIAQCAAASALTPTTRPTVAKTVEGSL